MLEHPPDHRHLPRWLLKLFVISACTLGVGLGLCGLDAHLYPHAQFGGSWLALVGAGLMVLAALALLLVILILLASLVSLMFPR